MAVSSLLQRDRFRAILLGILIADALSHRYLSWELRPAELPGKVEDSAPRLSRLAIESDRWCHHLSFTLSHLMQEGCKSYTFSHLPIEINEGLVDAKTSIVEAILFILPTFLLNIDSLDFGSLISDCQLTPSHQALSRAFYQWIVIFLNNNDLASAKLAWETQVLMTNLSSIPEKDSLVLALDHVLSAEGNFFLSLGQSLCCASHSTALNPLLTEQLSSQQSYSASGFTQLRGTLSSNPAGLPLLTGLLSACCVGCRGIPNRWYQALTNPTASLSYWLQNRWQISGIHIIDDWAEGLWQRWCGKYPMYSSTSESRIFSVVQPTAW